MKSRKASEERKRSQTLASGLYVVATPIGNLGDISLRALEVLKSADIIACEDTRVTVKLLRHYGISCPTISYHDHSDAKRVQEIIARLEAKERVALVSDAGTPLLSDPGFPLVRAAREAGIDVFAIPGASSIAAALSVAGLPTERFLFAGFLPTKDAARRAVLESFAHTPATLVFFESPRRIAASLAVMCELFGETHEAAVAREITKIHEEVKWGTLGELAAYYSEHEPKGEIVLLVAPREETPATSEAELETLLRDALKRLSLKDAVDAISKMTGCPRKLVYQKALTLKGER